MRDPEPDPDEVRRVLEEYDVPGEHAARTLRDAARAWLAGREQPSLEHVIAAGKAVTPGSTLTIERIAVNHWTATCGDQRTGADSLYDALRMLHNKCVAELQWRRDDASRALLERGVK